MPPFKFALIAATLALGAVGAVDGQTPHQRYLFLNPALIDQSDNVTVRTNPAQRRETVIFPDQPWEKHLISFFLTVRDENEKLRMWYVCRDDYGEGSQANLAYAESSDGVTWTKPNLGIHDYKGSRANNLVGVQSLEGVVFQDPNMPPEQRYVYVTVAKAAKSPTGATGIYRFYSPDGLHWKQDPEP
jgi:hypothetical protein